MNRTIVEPARAMLRGLPEFTKTENLELRFGFYFKVKRNLERWKPNQDDEYLSDPEIFVSYLSQMTKPHQNQLSWNLMYLVRGSLTEARSQHQAIRAKARGKRVDYQYLQNPFPDEEEESNETLSVKGCQKILRLAGMGKSDPQ